MCLKRSTANGKQFTLMNLHCLRKLSKKHKPVLPYFSATTCGNELTFYTKLAQAASWLQAYRQHSKIFTKNVNNGKPHLRITFFYCCKLKDFGFILCK